MKKLSELNSVELATVLCKIAEPAANIFSDPAVSDFFAKAEEARKEAPNAMVFYARLVALGAPVILGDQRREDIFAILAAVRGVDVQVIREQPGMQTVQEVVQALMCDTDMMTFFRGRPKGQAERNQRGDLPVRSATDDGGSC